MDVPFSEVVAHWEQEILVSIVAVAMLHPDPGSEATALMTLIADMNYILEPLRFVGAFADFTMASSIAAQPDTLRCVFSCS